MEKFFSIPWVNIISVHSVINGLSYQKEKRQLREMVFMSIYDLIPTTFMILLPLTFLLVKAPVIVCASSSNHMLLGLHIQIQLALLSQIAPARHLFNLVSKKQGEMIQNADVVFVNAQEEKGAQRMR